MLQKAGIFRFHTESYMCDFTAKVTLPVICNYMLDAASIHAKERGFGYERMLKDNVTWVLSRLSIEMKEYPAQNQSLIVETWVESVVRLFTQRCFRFIDQNGKVIGYARTIWAVIDINTRRPVDILSRLPDLSNYINLEMECPISKMEKISAVENVEPTIGYTVRYSDIDINKHTNSVKYIEHILNIFGLNFFSEKFICKFEMVYLAEGIFGDKVKLYQNKISDNEFIIDTKRGDESLCRSRIVWQPLFSI